MHIHPCDHMSNRGSDVSVSIPQPAPLQSNGSGYNTMQWKQMWEERAYKGSVQSLRENTRWEGVYDYIHQQLMLDESGDFRIIWERYLSFCDSVICVPKAMRDRLVVDMLIKEI